MFHRSSIGAVALGVLTFGVVALATSPLTTMTNAQSPTPSQYPDMSGQWHRIGPNRWEVGGKKAPLTAEYRKIYNDNQARMAAGEPGALRSWYCVPQGMPMMMNMYDPMEIVVTPNVTYILISHVNDSYRRIYTDGRGWPASEEEFEPTYTGYSLGKWVDQDGDGRYDVLEVETRFLKGPRVYDGSGLPLHHDNKSVIKERIYLDKTNPNIILNDITVIDNALTQPWSVTKKAGRDPNPRPIWRSVVCAEDNALVRIGEEAYYMSSDGYLMPTRKGQMPPDLRYFKQ